MVFIAHQVTALVLDALIHQLAGAGIVGQGRLRSRPFIGETGSSSTSLGLGMGVKVIDRKGCVINVASVYCPSAFHSTGISFT